MFSGFTIPSLHSSIYQDVFPVSQWLTAVITSAANGISIRPDNI
jgi:hypothetical protein